VTANREPQLLAGPEGQTYGERVDLDWDDLVRRELLDPVERVDGDAAWRPRLVEVPKGHTQMSVRTLVLQIRRPALRYVLQDVTVVGHVELLQDISGGIELLQEDEEIHVIPAVGPHPQPYLRVPDNLRGGIEANGERHSLPVHLRVVAYLPLAGKVVGVQSHRAGSAWRAMLSRRYRTASRPAPS
jgi:hypothetical protein